jgi:polyisoprenoid-binding protein YceI
MRRVFLPLLMLLGSAVHAAADHDLKVDRSRSFVDVDVKSTLDSFTGRLEAYAARLTADDADKIRAVEFSFKFANLRTGKPERDAKMIAWLGGGDPEGKFVLGALALTPSGQGRASGRLTFHGSAQMVEMPVQVSLVNGEYTITGHATIDYRDWGLKVIRKLGLAKVDPEVKIRFKLVAAPAPPK